MGEKTTDKTAENTKRITIRLPMAIYLMLERLVKHEDGKIASLCAFFVQRSTREMQIAGLIPPEGGGEIKPVARTREFAALDRILANLIDGKEVSELDISEAALITTISADELMQIVEKLREPNGSERVRA